MLKRFALPVSGLAVLLVASPALASFHLMKVEQVIGGVGGNTDHQAIQLRMRAAGQNLVGGAARLRAWDAAGLNPVTVIAFPSNVANSQQGRRILVVSPGFAIAQPSIAADFIMTNLIPASYLAAGRLTFEDTLGTIYWSLAWGGAAYTGPNTGTMTNDADGDFGPPFASPLPSATVQALLFSAPDATGAALSTTNAADYSITPGASTFTNNANVSGTVVPPPPAKLYSLTPCRLADTRDTPGPSGGPALFANTTRTFPVSGLCGVPPEARAVSIILTVVQETEVGNLRVYPAGGAVPTASAINFAANHAKANNAVIPLGILGSITVRCDMAPGSTGSTHFLFDVVGYFQ
ncbi:MAG: hypothetical protein ACHQKZ_02940 [Solirubrobacterales bacterium]